MGIIGDVGNAVGKPFTVLGTFNRHLVDPSMSFGVTSDRYNARDKYRTHYSDAQRTAAGLGTVFGTAVPAVALTTWLMKGARVPGMGAAQKVVTGDAAKLAGATIEKVALAGVSSKLGRGVAIGVGAAALGVATAVGVNKITQIVQDDGHFGAAGGALGAVGGTALGAFVGSKFAGKWAPVVALGAGIAGGIGGYVGGTAWKVGGGHIGEHFVKDAPKDATVGDRAKNFATGAFTHFTEVGPTSSGVSLGYAWKMRETDQKTASTSERGGHMLGDLGAVAVMGGGALATAGILTGMSTSAKYTPGVGGAIKSASDLLVKSPIANAWQDIGSGALNMANANKGASGAALAVGGLVAATALTGLAASKQYKAQMKASGGDTVQAGWAAGITTALAVGGAAALHVTAFKGLQTFGTMQRAAASALGAAALISVLSSARLPVQQFMNDVKDSHAKRDADPLVRNVAIGVGGAAAGGGAVKMLLQVVPAGGIKIGRLPTIPKAAVVAVGSLAAGAAGAYTGYGLSANLPTIDKVGIAGGIGAAAGAGLGLWAKGIGVPAGLAAGAAVGVMASSMLVKD
ncbi:MAG: hypothetical protein H7287_02425 [Thermoleophilia bacterium]|nr:hypothetical protein [Thermoleophilia bacterium]